MLKLFSGLLLLAMTVFTVILGSAPAAPAHAGVIPRGQAGCTDGQVVGTQNLVQDGNFAEAYNGVIRFGSDLPARPRGIYPDDPKGGGYSIQKGPVSYNGGSLIGRPFAGDPAREAPASETYFYSNPYVKNDQYNSLFYLTGEGLLWSQTVTVTPDTTYNFYAYFDNILPANSAANDSVIELRVDDIAGDSTPGIAAGPAITVTKVPDFWMPIQYSFTTGVTQTKAILEIWDVTGKSVADPYYGTDFGMVGINLRQCAAAVGIAKAVSKPVVNANGTADLTYTITLRNYGNYTGGTPPSVTNLQVTDDLATAFANAAGFTVRSITSTPNVTVNSAFTGISPNTRLLANGNSLPSGPTGVATITFTIRVTPGKSILGRGPFRNTAIVTATANGTTIEDSSVPGTNPDPSGNKNPKDSDENLPTEVSIGSMIALPFIQR
jgi:hypothetical protein